MRTECWTIGCELALQGTGGSLVTFVHLCRRREFWAINQSSPTSDCACGPTPLVRCQRSRESERGAVEQRSLRRVLGHSRRLRALSVVASAICLRRSREPSAGYLGTLDADEVRRLPVERPGVNVQRLCAVGIVVMQPRCIADHQDAPA